MIDKMICHKDDSLITVLKIINDNANGIVFVIDDEEKLCGTITDGDIRRALLNDIKLDESVGKIVSSNYIFAYDDESKENIVKKISKKIDIIPIVDKNKKVVDFFEYKVNTYFPVAIPNLNGNEFKYLTDAFMSTWISSSGEYINKFEDRFSSYSDCEYGIAVSNGTVALHLALTVLGIGEGDEVIIPDLTFAATINSVLHANATPVIVDVEENSWCINPKKIKEAITPNTKAIIPVHIYGQACNMSSIMEIAKEFNLKVIEDCAEAHGAKHANKKVGSFGDIGCFSFFGNKVITTGEGGMCTTNDKHLDEKMRIYRDHGMSKTKRYWHDVIGYNYRMTNLQASIGLAQLERINDIHQNRREYENNYKEILKDKNFRFQQDLENTQRITWLVSILVNDDTDKAKYLKILKDNGIDAREFFYPLSDMEIYKSYCKEFTSITHKLSKNGFNLPTYESLKSIDELKKILGEL
jgi:perosamine synthetase